MFYEALPSGHPTINVLDFEQQGWRLPVVCKEHVHESAFCTTQSAVSFKSAKFVLMPQPLPALPRDLGYHLFAPSRTSCGMCCDGRVSMAWSRTGRRRRRSRNRQAPLLQPRRLPRRRQAAEKGPAYENYLVAQKPKQLAPVKGQPEVDADKFSRQRGGTKGAEFPTSGPDRHEHWELCGARQCPGMRPCWSCVSRTWARCRRTTNGRKQPPTSRQLRKS